MTHTVSQDVAEAEFDRMCEAMDLDVDTSEMDEEDRKAFAKVRSRIVTAVQRGRVTVDERGQPTVALLEPVGDVASVTFREPRGSSFIAMDGQKKGHDVSKMIAVMSDMTKQPTAVFSRMANRDFQLCQRVVVLFLG